MERLQNECLKIRSENKELKSELTNVKEELKKSNILCNALKEESRRTNSILQGILNQIGKSGSPIQRSTLSTSPSSKRNFSELQINENVYDDYNDEIG